MARRPSSTPPEPKAPPKFKELRGVGKLTPALKLQIVKELAECFTPVLAARNAGISFECYRLHYHDDPEFKKAVDEARQAYANSLRREVHRRGVKGWKEPVFWQGAKVGEVTKYSDMLMIRHIARFDPSYRESTKVEQKTTLVGTIETLKGKVASLPAELKAQLRAQAKLLREQAAAPAPLPEEE